MSRRRYYGNSSKWERKKRGEGLYDLKGRECPFTSEQMAALYRVIKKALGVVKDPSKKALPALNGEIYTTLRREAKSGDDCANLDFLEQMLGRNRKFFGSDHRSVYLKGMIDMMKKDYLQEAKDELEDLKVALAGMNAAQADMEQINQRAERVMNEFQEIDRMLNPNTEMEA